MSRRKPFLLHVEYENLNGRSTCWVFHRSLTLTMEETSSASNCCCSLPTKISLCPPGTLSEERTVMVGRNLSCQSVRMFVSGTDRWYVWFTSVWTTISLGPKRSSSDALEEPSTVVLAALTDVFVWLDSSGLTWNQAGFLGGGAGSDILRSRPVSGSGGSLCRRLELLVLLIFS